MTQLDVVARLRQREAFLTNRTLSAMENGRGLDLGILPDLAAVLNCSITYLLGLARDPASWQPDQPLGGASAAQSVPLAVTGPERAADRCAWILGPDVPDTGPRSGTRRAGRSPT